MAGLRVGRPVGVLLPWGVIAVAAPWPIGTQPPLVKCALIQFYGSKRGCCTVLQLNTLITNDPEFDRN